MQDNSLYQSLDLHLNQAIHVLGSEHITAVGLLRTLTSFPEHGPRRKSPPHRRPPQHRPLGPRLLTGGTAATPPPRRRNRRRRRCAPLGEHRRTDSDLALGPRHGQPLRSPLSGQPRPSRSRGDNGDARCRTRRCRRLRAEITRPTHSRP